MEFQISEKVMAYSSNSNKLIGWKCKNELASLLENFIHVVLG